MSDSESQGLDPRIASLMLGGQVLIDVGCGAGKALDELSRSYDVAIGLDVNTKRLAERLDPLTDWYFILSDLNSYFPFQSQSADAVHANQVIEHIGDPRFFAAEIHRILRRGGVAVITTPNVRYIKHLFRLCVRGLGPQTAGGNTLDGPWDDGHIHYFTHHDLRGGKKKLIIRSLFDHFASTYFVRVFLSGCILVVARK